MPFLIKPKSADPQTHTVYIQVRLKHYDGTTERQIAAASGGYVIAINQNAIKTGMVALELDTPLTHFKKGETLRVTYEAWIINSAGNGGYIAIGHDPENRATSDAEEDGITFGTAPSINIVQVPYKLDI